MDTLKYLLIAIPLYATSAFFRLGSISLSCIFFGYWAVIPLLLLFAVLSLLAARNKINEMALMLVPSNMFVVSSFIDLWLFVLISIF